MPSVMEASTCALRSGLSRSSREAASPPSVAIGASGVARAGASVRFAGMGVGRAGPDVAAASAVVDASTVGSNVRTTSFSEKPMTTARSSRLTITSMMARNTEKFQELRRVFRKALYSSWVLPWRRKRSSRVLTNSASETNSTKVMGGFTVSSGKAQVGTATSPRAAYTLSTMQPTS